MSHESRARMETETHSFAEQYARDLEVDGNPRVALNIHGTPAKTRAGVRRLAVVKGVEYLPNDRVRITLDTGRTMTMPGSRWVLCEYSAFRTVGLGVSTD